MLFVAVLIFVSDQTANAFKEGFQRLRPGSDPEINSIIRVVKSSATFSFFSGHATNSMGVATFLYLIFNKDYKYFWLLFIWPLIFAYSRIYLGLHYPLDIICGYFCGAILGFLMFKLYRILQNKYFSI
jgi:undecaprenyl-diphosphatase